MRRQFPLVDNSALQQSAMSGQAAAPTSLGLGGLADQLAQQQMRRPIGQVATPRGQRASQPWFGFPGGRQRWSDWRADLPREVPPRDHMPIQRPPQPGGEGIPGSPPTQLPPQVPQQPPLQQQPLPQQPQEPFPQQPQLPQQPLQPPPAPSIGLIGARPAPAPISMEQGRNFMTPTSGGGGRQAGPRRPGLSGLGGWPR